VPLRRADRLFDISCILRAASRPVTAAAIADELEVTVRTIYRDVATLQRSVERDTRWGLSRLRFRR